jgi:hypothetical protein
MSLIYRNPASVDFTIDMIEKDIKTSIEDKDFILLALSCITLYNGVVNGADYAYHEMNSRLAKKKEELVKRDEFDQMIHLCVQADLLEIYCVELDTKEK